jgi:cyanophycin synthetase
MKLVEIRDLDGPNIFLLEPAIKVEFALDETDETPESQAALARRFQPVLGTPKAQALPEQLIGAVAAVHSLCGVTLTNVTWQPLETPGHVAFAFGWSHRRFAMSVAKVIAEAACGPNEVDERQLAELRLILNHSEPLDSPLMVRDAERTIPIVSITGTNGKTTTTRLIAHILRQSGKKVGWSSSSGVFIEGEQVMDGDYTGPSGALRVLDDPEVEVAVLETARGGILLRGIAYGSNDVGVFTNVSADHLDLQGIRTVDGLAEAKATVIRITKPEGYAVLNADDPLVVAQAPKTLAQVFFVTQSAENKITSSHIKAGGHALTVENGHVLFWQKGEVVDLIAVEEIPIAFGGSARHMIENALCGAAACLGLGLDPERVRDGLAKFTSTPADNLGRLNLYEVGGTTVVVDFAHNEAGLRHLLDLATRLTKNRGSLIAIIGTAGDRTDANLEAIGRIAAESADRVIIKETAKYLRGRKNNDELNQHYVAGIKLGGKREWTIAPSELDGLKLAVAESTAGDVIALMCVEQVQDVYDYLRTVGVPSPLGQVHSS